MDKINKFALVFTILLVIGLFVILPYKQNIPEVNASTPLKSVTLKVGEMYQVSDYQHIVYSGRLSQGYQCVTIYQAHTPYQIFISEYSPEFVAFGHTFEMIGPYDFKTITLVIK